MPHQPWPVDCPDCQSPAGSPCRPLPHQHPVFPSGHRRTWVPQHPGRTLRIEELYQERKRARADA